MFEVFNGSFITSDQIGQTKNIPPSMHQSYKRLLNASPKARLSVSQFRDQGRRSGGFFETPLIKLSQGLDSLGLKSDGEREEFLRFVSSKQELTRDADHSTASWTRFRMTFLKNFSVSKSCLSFSSRSSSEGEDRKSLRL